MFTATCEAKSESLDPSISVHHYTLRAPCPNSQGTLERPEAVRSRSHGLSLESGSLIRYPARVWFTPTSVLFHIILLYPWTL